MGGYDFIETNQLTKEKLTTHGLIMKAHRETKVMINFLHMIFNKKGKKGENKG